MEMKGGGVFKLKPGQVTDDSEMAFHLLRALSALPPSSDLQDTRLSTIIRVAG